MKALRCASLTAAVLHPGPREKAPLEQIAADLDRPVRLSLREGNLLRSNETLVRPLGWSSSSPLMHSIAEWKVIETRPTRCGAAGTALYPWPSHNYLVSAY